MTEWMAEAACVGSGVEFTPDERADPLLLKAAEFCRSRCQVRAECVAWADSQHPGLWGVYGGMLYNGGRRPRMILPRPETERPQSGAKAEHGTRPKYRSGCRCEPCVTTYRATERERARMRQARARARGEAA